MARFIRLETFKNVLTIPLLISLCNAEQLQKRYKIAPVVPDVFNLLPTANVKMLGPINNQINKIIKARMLSDKAENEIYPEAINAFRNRVDDRLAKNQGLWQGEFWGKWVLATSAAYRYTGNPKLKKIIKRAAADLIATQREDGYIGTYHNSGFVKRIDTKGNWNIWCRKYTLWGLIESYEILNDPKILQAAQRHMNHLMTETGPGKINIIDTGTFNGLPSTSILSPLIYLYRHTSEKGYLEYANYIVEQWSFYPNKPPDIINKGLSDIPIHHWFTAPELWTKSYEFISCVEGLLELYRITGKKDYLTASENIYKNIQEYERVITGAIAHNDKFRGARFIIDNAAEPCDSVYWMRLSVQLLRLTGKPVYADEIERTMYNVLLSALTEDGVWGARRLALSSTHWPAPGHCKLKTHHCCVNNVPRGLLQIPEIMVMQNKNEIIFNLYIPGKINVALPSGNNLNLNIDSDYPVGDTVLITVKPDKPETFTLQLRIPEWSRLTKLKINGKGKREIKPGSYAIIKQKWQPGDKIELSLDMRGRIIRFPHKKGSVRNFIPHVAVMRGPIVLARDIRFNDGNLNDPLFISIKPGQYIELEQVDNINNFQMVFQVPLSHKSDGKKILMTDYSSAGRTWDIKTSDFRVWLRLEPDWSKYPVDLRK